MNNERMQKIERNRRFVIAVMLVTAIALFGTFLFQSSPSKPKVSSSTESQKIKIEDTDSFKESISKITDSQETVSVKGKISLSFE